MSVVFLLRATVRCPVASLPAPFPSLAPAPDPPAHRGRPRCTCCSWSDEVPLLPPALLHSLPCPARLLRAQHVLSGQPPVLGLLHPLQHTRAPHWASWWPGHVLQSCRRHRSGHRATCRHRPTLLSAPSLCVALTPSGQPSSCGCLCVSPLPSASVFLWYCVLALLISCGLARDWTCRRPCMLVAITDELGPPARNHLVTILLLLCFPA